MKKSKFLKRYFSILSLHLDKLINQTYICEEIIQKIKKIKINKKKVIIFGNGGSASTASHFSTDLTKNARIRCINFNESNLITCFANDYGYANFLKQALNDFGDKGDLLILLSVSGGQKSSKCQQIL